MDTARRKMELWYRYVNNNFIVDARTFLPFLLHIRYNNDELLQFSCAGAVEIYFNQTSITFKNGITSLAKDKTIVSNGHMVLGQYSPDKNNAYDLSLAYIGR